MSKVQMLRASVSQRLSAAAEEIFELFERTIAEYEEELCRSQEENKRQQKLLDAVLRPEVRILRADVQQVLVSKDEVPPEQQQERSPSLDQEEPPEPPHIKEEEEELWSSQGGEQLGASQLHPSQTEEKGDKKHLKTELGGEDCGGPEPTTNISPLHRLHPAPHHINTLDSSECETEDSCEWEETRELQPGFNTDEDSVTGKTPVSSSGCRSSGHKGHLQKHNTNQTEEKPFSCSVCGRRYSLKNSLTTHMRLHSEGKHFSCSVCKKTFPWREKVVRHMRVHTGEKPFSCSLCGARFADSSNLTSHLRVHTGEKPFSCLVCKASFGLRNNLVKHMGLHTEEKPFRCSVCGERFAQQGDLRRHLTAHAVERPFSCSICGKIFSQKGNLTRHLTVHTGEKPYCCSICGKGFTRLQYVRKHKCGATELS
ncbi:zinc finger protein OZF-like [Pempheris klunzingeri]|uniref:zinc finger protein OZF-like n=1 Tax=Pempheris klunzingeri TaxID=3127111 RepID=UPI00397EC302